MKQTDLIRPLSLKELQDMVGAPVWCEDYHLWGIVKCETIGCWANKPFLIGVHHSPEFGTCVNFEYNIEARRLKLYRQPPKENENDGN